MTLADYVAKHTVRGACQCGKCCDAPDEPSERQPNGHTSDLFFFQVAKKGEPTVEELTALIREYRGGFIKLDPLDGEEHNYIELGGWIGDQGLAMQFMGLGELLGLWRVMTPNCLPGLPQELKANMAGKGLVSIVRKE